MVPTIFAKIFFPKLYAMGVLQLGIEKELKDFVEQYLFVHSFIFLQMYYLRKK
jgi:hypothetical protein